MLTTASCWRECTRCFCFASPSNFAFTWATSITIHINSCPVKCCRNVSSPDLAGDKNCEPANQWRQPGWRWFGTPRNVIFICPPDRIMSGDSWWAVEINVRCGDVTHLWAAQLCLIRMVRLQLIALLATSRQAWGKALLLRLVKRRSTCGSERSNDSSTRDVRRLE